MGCRKDLTDDEKQIIIKELANATTPEVIANRINRHVKLPGATSARIFKEAGVPGIAKSTRNRILANMAETKCPKKNPLLTTRHKTLRMDWAKTYMKTDMKYILFTDESKATLDNSIFRVNWFQEKNNDDLPSNSLDLGQ